MSSASARSNKPILLANAFRQQIQSGALRVGERLPSFAEMREQYGASTLTVDRAFAILEGEGLIVRVNGSGTFVAPKRENVEIVAPRPLLGLVLPNCQTPFFSAIIGGVERAARAAGYGLLIANSQGNLELEAQVLAEVASQTVGLCAMPSSVGNQSAFAPLLEKGVPFVLLDREVAGLAVPLVTCDNELGSFEATRHLLSLGRVPFVVGETPEMASTLRDRIDGYKRALKAAGVPLDPSRLRLGAMHQTPESVGYEQTRGLLESGVPLPLAIFALNEWVARGAYVAIKERGLQIPRDVAVVGFDDVEAHSFDPPLSSVHQDLPRIGARLIERLIEVIKHDSSARGTRKSFQTKLAPRLVVRNSSDENSDFCIVSQLVGVREQTPSFAPNPDAPTLISPSALAA